MNWESASQIATAAGVLIAALTLGATLIGYAGRIRYERAREFSAGLIIILSQIDRMRSMVQYDFADDIAAYLVEQKRFDDFFQNLQNAEDPKKFTQCVQEYFTRFRITAAVHTEFIAAYEQSSDLRK